MIKFCNEEIKYLALELPDSVKHYKYNGDFEGEISEIDRCLSSDLLPALRRRLDIERVIAEGMRHDYTADFAALLAKIQTRYPACGERELREIISMGQADYILRSGEPYFQNSAASNIFNCHKTYLERLTHPDFAPDTASDAMRMQNVEIMRQNGGRAFRFTVEESLEVAQNAERVGERIRVHLPYPAPCQSQDPEDIKLIECSHDSYFISDAVHRTICIDTKYRAGERFLVKFSYVNRARFVQPDAAAVDAVQPSFYTEQLYPHIRFTPLVRELAQHIAGDEKNPFLLARRAYDWVTKNVKYSYMREYLYIDNIVEFAILNRRGDCGVMAALFITLCRYMGIPARFESGSAVKPDDIGSHDWATFYIAPYGWLYADPSYGGGALRRGNEALWNHYFGNLDPFRMVANNDFQQSFDPPKAFMRMDPYDNQSGEAEFETVGLGKFDTKRQRSVISAEEIV
ncbi:MAG: transglutaminase domain-containing protein [Clostridia bacterium]|nr:transglutaminase domain-containing protein [Clostridia bacterium]